MKFADLMFTLWWEIHKSQSNYFKIKAWLYSYWLLRYPLKSAPAVPASRCTFQWMFQHVITYGFNSFFPCMWTTSWLHLTIIIVPHHLCFGSVGVLPTGDMASYPHWSWTHVLYCQVPQGMWTGRKTLPKQTNSVWSVLKTVISINRWWEESTDFPFDTAR